MSVRCLECRKVKKKKNSIKIAFHTEIAKTLKNISVPPWICKRCAIKEGIIED